MLTSFLRISPIFIVSLLSVLIVLLGQGSPADLQGAVNLLDYWLNRYQTLLGGLAAIAAAAIALRGLKMQLADAEKHREDDQKRSAWRLSQENAAAARSFAGEVQAISEHLMMEGRRLAAMGSAAAAETVLDPVPASRVFDAMADKVGQLGPGLAGHVTNFYGRTTLWKGTLAQGAATAPAITRVSALIQFGGPLQQALLEYALWHDRPVGEVPPRPFTIAPEHLQSILTARNFPDGTIAEAVAAAEAARR
jgi:hypothetical protein